MIDYISASTFLIDKDTPNFSKCECEAVYKSGLYRYFINGCNKAEIDWNAESRMIRFKGSIMYFWQGHNITFSKESFVEAITYISELLNVNLWNFEVDAFEYGKILPVERKPKEYILHHSSAPSAKLEMNEKPKDKGKFRWWEDKNVSLKMYDAGANFQTKVNLNKKEILESIGWADTYLLKWEAHYKKPSVLNKGVYLILADLVNPNWERKFSSDLYYQYKRLIPMQTFITPNNKRDLSTSDIVVQELLQMNLNEGKNLEEVKKMLYARINSISDEILSKSDKDARKRQIKALLDKVQVSSESSWDLSSKLAEALDEFKSVEV